MVAGALERWLVKREIANPSRHVKMKLRLIDDNTATICPSIASIINDIPYM